jgi:hypothetical protein
MAKVSIDNSKRDKETNISVIENAARLLRDAKLLVAHARFASAFALAVLGMEEIGKVVLDIWGQAGPLSKPINRRTFHARKQAAVGSLMLASFAVEKFGLHRCGVGRNRRSDRTHERGISGKSRRTISSSR